MNVHFWILPVCVYFWTWLNFTRPPPPLIPEMKNGIFRNIPKIRNIPFFPFLVCPGFFWNIPIFQDIQKKRQGVYLKCFLRYSHHNTPKSIFCDIPIFQIFAIWVCPKFKLEYSGIFRYSRIWLKWYVPDLKWNIPKISNKNSYPGGA